jgi:hypothetical protein
MLNLHCYFTTPAASITGGALTGNRRGLRFDRELFYAGAMFHERAGQEGGRGRGVLAIS